VGSEGLGLQGCLSQRAHAGSIWVYRCYPWSEYLKLSTKISSVRFEVFTVAAQCTVVRWTKTSVAKVPPLSE
jgi:hypothetical protein